MSYYTIVDMFLDIPEGEVLDRLSILEIKSNKIHNTLKLAEIYKEILSLSAIEPIKRKHIIYYKLLVFVNTQVWDLTDRIKTITNYDSTFAEIAHTIFDLNQQRFRMKNIVNILENSSIKEQKSYKQHIFYGIINDTSTMTDAELINVLLYASLEYDSVTFTVYNASVREYYTKLLHIIPNITHVTYNNTIDYIECMNVVIPAHYRDILCSICIPT